MGAPKRAGPCRYAPHCLDCMLLRGASNYKPSDPECHHAIFCRAWLHPHPSWHTCGGCYGGSCGNPQQTVSSLFCPVLFWIFLSWGPSAGWLGAVCALLLAPTSFKDACLVL
eukprot:1159051-Pelagomonas_calceolata.AAC.7